MKGGQIAESSPQIKNSNTVAGFHQTAYACCMKLEFISSANLRRAAEIKDKIEELESELSKILGHFVGNGSPAKVRTQKSGKRRMSAAAKAKIAAAQRARWAKWKAAKK